MGGEEATTKTCIAISSALVPSSPDDSYLPLRRLVEGRITAVQGEHPAALPHAGTVLEGQDDGLHQHDAGRSHQHHGTQDGLVFCTSNANDHHSAYHSASQLVREVSRPKRPLSLL